jgi:DNA-nicking Smr family endonuclease
MIDKKDLDTFAEAVRDVKRLGPLDTVARQTPRPPAKARFTRQAESDVLRESLLGDSAAGDEAAFRRAGISENVFRQLRRGRFSIEDEIDLHGMTSREAKQALREFIADCLDRGVGCVRVIHGKGRRSGPSGPVLKGRVQQWLMQWDPVLAFVSAGSRDGGSGALYVLLARR